MHHSLTVWDQGRSRRTSCHGRRSFQSAPKRMTKAEKKEEMKKNRRKGEVGQWISQDS